MIPSRLAETTSQTALGDDKVELFLCVCLKSQWNSDAQQQRTRMIAEGDIDWATVLDRARSQRLSPLLYHLLCDERRVPIETLQSLRAAYDYSARYNLYLFGELRRVLVRSKEAGVPILLLKGAALAHILYKDPAERALRDLDILVPREQVASVEDIVNALGYRAHRAEPQPGAALAYESQLMFFKTAPLLSQIEIHWSLIDSPFYQYKLSTDWLWQTAVPFSLGDVNALMLGPEAQILHLCAHLLLHHGGNDLLWLNDIAKAIHSYQTHVDWDELLRRADEFGLVVPTRKILFQLASEWGIAIPKKILERLNELDVTKKEMEVTRRMTAPARTSAQRLWADSLAIPGWQQKIMFVWVHLFPSKDYMQRRYRITNLWLFPFYYPYRWWLGAHRAARKRR